VIVGGVIVVIVAAIILSKGLGTGTAQAKLPTFQTATDDGGTISNTTLKTPAIIHVFASWCPICRREAPAFAQLQHVYPGMTTYLLDVDDTPTKGAAAAERYGWSYRAMINDPARKLEAKLHLIDQPNTIFVARDGSITIARGGSGYPALAALASKSG
jgi:cytochrome c biogenesis protein CcmG/thiol:disulfide interchange protein DsbE